LAKHQLDQEDIIIRMTGCPNGCARPYVAEIGLVGTALGKYNLHIGGDHQGERLNKLYKENLEEAAILNELDNLFYSFKNNRINEEHFGDFTERTY
jgi:sulfite reductase (NADPH) hemoprotein beta-component